MMKPFGFLGGKDNTFLAEGFVLSAMTIFVVPQDPGGEALRGGSWRRRRWVLMRWKVGVVTARYGWFRDEQRVSGGIVGIVDF